MALGQPVRLLWRWCRCKKPPIPFYRIGGRLMFKLSEVNAFVESRKNAKQ